MFRLTVLQFGQRPPSEPCMRFSRTLLSDILFRSALSRSPPLDRSYESVDVPSLIIQLKSYLVHASTGGQRIKRASHAEIAGKYPPENRQGHRGFLGFLSLPGCTFPSSGLVNDFCHCRIVWSVV